jgi:phospholipid/cholesterol/gamma-HCH transport system substrate-binding protein
MKHSGKEFMVGCLVVLAVGLALVFGWLMGLLGPFHREARYELLYGFAGGVEVGSPVRVSGVKVGKVEAIQFLPEEARKEHEKQSDLVTLQLTISVADKARSAVRRDSRFYVNMAGIIGERYIEISPGSRDQAELPPGSVVRGVDPPRIDQLLSQGYGVFGRIQDFLDRNEKSVSDLLTQVDLLIGDLNKALKAGEKRRIISLIDNLNDISIDVKQVTKRFNDRETKEFFTRVDELVKRAHDIDKPALHKFLQEEGIRARIF